MADIFDIAIAKALAGGGGGGGGSSAFVVNVEVSFDDETGSYSIDSLDKSFADILNAYNNSVVIMARVHEDGSENDPNILYLHDISTNASFGYVQFSAFNTYIDNGSISSITADTLFIDSSTAEYKSGYYNFN